jgi:hypothetical protein
MTGDREIANAIKSGERNREVTELIHNWCTHARVEKFGGIGIIEMQTGLPIGHHSMACDYASAGGMAAYDLADAALDFHDRNCVGCTLRNPRRLPNLTQLIRERDEARNRATLQSKQAADDQARAFAERQLRRDEFRHKVSVGSATVLEQLEELDRDPTEARREQLVQTAKLAPEIFGEEILEHLFSLLEAKEEWFIEAGLRTLAVINAEPARLARAALTTLARGYVGAQEAGEVLVSHTAFADPSLIPAALRALVLLAYPPRSVFSGSEARAPIPEPLYALYGSYPDAVKLGIDRLLGSRQPRVLRAGANAITVIHEIDRTISAPFARSVVAVLARAETVVDFHERFERSEMDELAHDLQRALSLALETSPTDTDEIVGSFIQTSRSEGQARILRSYDQLFRGRRDEPIQEIAAHTVALKRLIEIASAAQAYDVLMGVLSVIRHDIPAGLEALVRREITHLIGAAVLLDARRSSLHAEARVAKNGLEAMEKQTLVSLISQLQEGFIKWCASAAAESEAATNAYVEVLRGLPDTQEDVRAIMVTALAEIMTSAEGLNAALPSFYTALVGSSQRLRAAALEAFSKLDRVHREDLPDMLHEAFVISLQDPYVIVHQAAVRSLENFDVPTVFRSVTRELIRKLILVYSHNREKHADEFLMTCISLYASRYGTPKELDGDFGALLVSQMGTFEPYVVVRKIGWLHKKLAHAAGFAAMTIKLLSSSRADSLDDQVVRTLRSLDSSAIFAERETLARIAIAEPRNRDLTAIAVELLTAAGAWQDAGRVATAAAEAISDTTRNRPFRLFMNLLRIATAYEAALAADSLKELSSLDKQWQATQEALEQDRKENEKRRDLFPGFSSTDFGE